MGNAQLAGARRSNRGIFSRDESHLYTRLSHHADAMAVMGVKPLQFLPFRAIVHRPWCEGAIHIKHEQPYLPPAERWPGANAVEAIHHHLCQAETKLTVDINGIPTVSAQR
jgi:hypothetical protein